MSVEDRPRLQAEDALALSVCSCRWWTKPNAADASYYSLHDVLPGSDEWRCIDAVLRLSRQRGLSRVLRVQSASLLQRFTAFQDEQGGTPSPRILFHGIENYYYHDSILLSQGLCRGGGAKDHHRLVVVALFLIIGDIVGPFVVLQDARRVYPAYLLSFQRIHHHLTRRRR